MLTIDNCAKTARKQEHEVYWEVYEACDDSNFTVDKDGIVRYKPRKNKP